MWEEVEEKKKTGMGKWRSRRKNERTKRKERQREGGKKKSRDVAKEGEMKRWRDSGMEGRKKRNLKMKRDKEGKDEWRYGMKMEEANRRREIEVKITDAVGGKEHGNKDKAIKI